MLYSLLLAVNFSRVIFFTSGPNYRVNILNIVTLIVLNWGWQLMQVEKQIDLNSGYKQFLLFYKLLVVIQFLVMYSL